MVKTPNCKKVITINNYTIINGELYHYGVKGMKWGVRRYQNYDGSYTRAGVKRFNESLAKYEKANTRYKNAKTSGSSKAEVTNARLARKQAKRTLDKDYKHLKQDKMGDKGKELYSKGKTIRGNDQVKNMLAGIGSLSLSAAAFNHNFGVIGSQKVTSLLAVIGTTSITAAGIKGAVNNSQDKKLRAYYGHTSNRRKYN